MHVDGRCTWWIGSSVLRMLEIFSWDHHPEVEGDDITVVVAGV